MSRITPVVITYNEAANLERTLGKLGWARDVVVVDSYSDDDTLAIAARHPNVRVVQRVFDDFAHQWNFALEHTGIATEWVLALDADYVLTDELIAELTELVPPETTAGYRAAFVYCVSGRPLRGSLYPPVTILFRRRAARYRQDGHTQRVVVSGEVSPLRGSVLHDDRKSFRRWLRSQLKYAGEEAPVIRTASWNDLSWPDRIRKLRVVAPIAVLFYCLILRRGLLDGRRGLVYAGQRCLAELMLSSALLRGDMTVTTASKPRSS